MGLAKVQASGTKPYMKVLGQSRQWVLDMSHRRANEAINNVWVYYNQRKCRLSFYIHAILNDNRKLTLIFLLHFSLYMQTRCILFHCLIFKLVDQGLDTAIALTDNERL